MTSYIYLRKLLSNLLVFCLIYFIYVYPFYVLNYLITNEQIFKLSSLLLTFLFFILISFYFKSHNTFFLFRLFIYEGMGFGFISFWITNFGLIISILYSITSPKFGISCFLIILILTFISLINGKKIKLKKINITSIKFKKTIKFIFLSDIHLGTNSSKHLEKIISKIKNLDYDFILIGGDLIDSSSFKLDGLLKFLNIKKPILFISGNHEYYIKNSKDKLKELKNYNLLFLDNKSFKIDKINIVGVSDNQNNLNQIKIVNKFIDENLFNLVVVHKPTIWNSIYKKTDLMLSGHTHNGQIFPFNLLVKFKFKYLYGLYEKLNSKLYVSSGSSCWGPKMRLGSNNEIIYFFIN